MFISDPKTKQITFQCDDCSVQINTHIKDFMDANALMKGSKWRVYRDKDIWKHACPLCVQAFVETNRLTRS